MGAQILEELVPELKKFKQRVWVDEEECSASVVETAHAKALRYEKS